jgi:ADP-dependent NAD(P)H-hydrate dehydratase / NAD(P)H-hydrate epimerase
MRVFSASGMRAADAAASAAGVDSFDLMRAAGRAVADALRRRWPAARRVLVACGPGNNGGDGYVAARALLERGLAVRLLELHDRPTTADAARAREELLAAPVAVRLERLGAEPVPDQAEADVVVDALFGSGLSRPISGVAAALIARMNEWPTPVLAVDVPSGVHADRAGLGTVYVRAAATVQLAGAVIASALAPARGAFGDWEVADIGIPAAALDAHAVGTVLEPADVTAALSPLPDDLHKYRAGTVAVLGGSERYAGAAELAARGAYRAGAGLVTLIGASRAPGGWPEVIWEPLAPDADPAAALRALGARRAVAVVLGPGWEREPSVTAAALAAAPGPVVLDAGALQGELVDVARRRGHVVLTPHHGEAARLLADLSARGALEHAIDVHDDPVAAARALALAWSAVVVLKGAGTVIADPEGRLALSRAGHPAMATGGTGDVLAGVLAALLASGRRLATRRFDLVAAGTLLHGLAGEFAAAANGPGMVAGDLVAALPAARARLEALAAETGA